MNIQFEKGEMVVIHSEGSVDRYQKSDLLEHRSMRDQEISEIQDEISLINTYILNIESSIGAN